MKKRQVSTISLSGNSVLLKDLEERKVATNSLINVYKDAPDLWNQVNGLLEGN
jgi:hypothetical protein